MNKRKRFISILAGIMAAVMILSLILGILPTIVSAESSSEIRKQINSLQQDRKDIKTQISDLKVQYQANTDEIAGIVARKNVIDQEIGLLHTEILNINEQISAYSVLIADSQEDLDRAEARFETMNNDCKVRIRAMEEEGKLSYWSVLFNANSFSDLLDRLNMVEEIAASDTRRLQALSEAAQQVVSFKAQLDQEKDELEVTRKDLDAAQSELDQKREEADQLIVELIRKGEELSLQQEDLEKEDENLLAEIAQKEKEYNQAKQREWEAYMATYVPPTTAAPTINISDSNGNSGSTGGIVESGGNTSSGNSGTNSGSSSGGGNSNVNVGSSWRVPCSYKKLTSPFGMRESPTTGASSYHQGVDLSADAGTPIYASRGGTVTTATYSGNAGYYVTINHGDGFSSIYMHMTNFIVRAGQSVNQGQVIGYVGKTGIATGNHLHFGIAYNGAYQNPCSYVGLY